MIIGLAPMDGFTDCAYREIVQEIFDMYGDKRHHQLFLRTEFMSANGYVANPMGVGHHLMTTEKQKNIIVQIHGGEKEYLLKTIKDIQKKYALHGTLAIENGKSKEARFSGIELNTGCPANNIMKSGGGSYLLKDKARTLEIIKAMNTESILPFSIKTRTGIHDEDKIQQKNFILQASKYCDMITIHGRTVKQVYSGDVDRDFMYEIKREVERANGGKIEIGDIRHKIGDIRHETICKILGNGGITSYEEIQAKKGNLDGILIGQAAIGNPRIFTPHVPTIEEKKETILKHLHLMIACTIYYKQLKKLTMPTRKQLDDIVKKIPNMKHSLAIERTIVAFRKHLFQYVKGIPAGREWKMKISQIKEYKPIVDAIQNFLV